MKRTNVIFFLFCFLVTSTFVPIITIVSAQSNSASLKLSLIQAEDNSTMIAGGGVTTFGYWGPSTYYFSGGDTLRNHALETLFGATFSTEDILDGYVPLLATGYNIVEAWPSEENSLGFNNSGGIRVLDVYLRENVKFHDGSEWNATVAKWNYDRWITLVGNLTGTQVWTQWKSLMFRPARDMHNLYTETWNMSHYYDNDPVFGTPLTPQYYGRDNDPDLTWTSVNNTYQVEGWYPVINKTLIVKNATETASGTGGTIRFEFNDWTTGLNFISLLVIISMEAYKDYFYTQFFDNYDGYGGVYTPLVGTGQYKYKSLDSVGTLRATLERFDDHWNFTGMRDAGLMNVKEGIVQYYTGAQTPQERTTAILSGDIDFAADGAYGQLYPDQITTSPSVDYFATDPADSTEQIAFQWKNTDKALRTAIGYAFNYSKYIAVGKDGRGVISDTPFGVNSVWRNPSIVGPSHDLSNARQTLLDDPLYGSLLANQSITSGSTTQDWHDFADDISAGTLNSTFLKAFTLNYWSDQYSNINNFVDIFETSIYDIGMVFNSSAEWELTGAESVFDKLLAGNTRAWGAVEPYFTYMECFLIDWPMPRLDSGGYLQAYLSTVSYYWDPVMWLDISENFNYGDVYNQTLSNLIRSLVVQDPTTKQDTYDDIARLIYEENPHIYLAQDDTGYAVSKKYSIDWTWDAFFFGYVGIGPGIPEAGIELPPDTILITVIVIGVVVVLAIAVYIVMRRRSS